MEVDVNSNKDYSIIRFRVLRGFAVYQWTKPDVLPFYSIQPNGSQRVFFFRTFAMADEFCQHFTNNHSDGFWLKRWSKVRSKNFVEGMNSLEAQF